MRLKYLTATLLASLSLSACTSTQVVELFAGHGIPVDDATATAISNEVSRPKVWHEKCHKPSGGVMEGPTVDGKPTVLVANRGPGIAAIKQWVECLIRARWAGTGQADHAVAIARRESGLNPGAKNKSSTASGIFQCLRLHWAGRFDPFDPIANIGYSFGLWKASGWKPWRLTR